MVIVVAGPVVVGATQQEADGRENEALENKIRKFFHFRSFQFLKRPRCPLRSDAELEPDSIPTRPSQLVSRVVTIHMTTAKTRKTMMTRVYTCTELSGMESMSCKAVRAGP